MSMKHVVLFGGSFNPPHLGHFEMAKHIVEALPVDEIWFLFSENVDKDPSIYAPLEHRIAMADILNEQYKKYPFVMSDAEYKTGTHLTADVLTELSKMYPDYNFIWAMGADNLTHFHFWDGYRRIIENFPMILFNRSTYGEKTCPAFEDYGHLMRRNPQRLLTEPNGVHFLDNPHVDISSTSIRKALAHGHSIEGEQYNSLNAYISKHNLYK